MIKVELSIWLGDGLDNKQGKEFACTLQKNASIFKVKVNIKSFLALLYTMNVGNCAAAAAAHTIFLIKVKTHSHVIQQCL